MTVVAFVLLIACVNLAGVMSARTLERQRESSIRAAVGAGRAALVRLFLWESIWIAIAAAWRRPAPPCWEWICSSTSRLKAP